MINGIKIIAVCTSRLNDSATYDFVNEVNNLIVEQDWRMFVYHVCSDYYWDNADLSADSAIYDLIDFDIVDAIIIMDEKLKSKKITDYIVGNASKNNIPVIIIDNHHENCISVSFDYKSGFEKVVKHVIEEHNIKNVHFMAGIKGNVFSDERLDIFKKVIEENGIEFKEDMVSYGLFWAEPTRQVMEDLVRRETMPEAIICANDIMAINVCAVLEKYGYKIPEDIKVTGFDGIDEIYFLKSQITSAICNYELMAKKVYEILLDIFLGWNVNKEQYLIPEFICGQSCGCDSQINHNDNNYYNRLNTRFYRYQDDIKKLSDISLRMQDCNSIKEMSETLHNPVFNSLTVYINETCIDETKSANDVFNNGYKDDFIVIYNYHDNSTVGNLIKRNNIYSEIDSLFSKKVPIIFNALYSFDKLFGYVCFYFDNPDITNFGKLTQIVSSLSIGISAFMNVNNQKYLRRRLEEIYKTDSLTGLLNRQGFDAEFAKLKKDIIAKKGSILAVLSDLDRLKTINDTYGHVAGDKAIEVTANALKNACINSLSVRFGGDEFLAVVPIYPEDENYKSKNNPSGYMDIKEIVKDIQARMKMNLDLFNSKKEVDFDVSASLGFYRTNNPDNMNFDYLVSAADKSLYNVKKKHHKLLDKNK